MGGMITQAMAINHPSKVKSMCSVMSHTSDRKNGGIALSLIREIGRQPAPTLENSADQSVIGFRAVSGDHFDEEAHRKLATEGLNRSFTAPALVIHRLQDPLIKPTGGIATAAAIPGSRLLMLPDMGHNLPRPRWEEMRDAMIQNFRRA